MISGGKVLPSTRLEVLVDGSMGHPRESAAAI